MRTATWLPILLAWSAATSAAGVIDESPGPGHPPRGWVEVAPPSTAAEWLCANHAGPDHSISGKEQDPLRIHNLDAAPRPDLVLQLTDGKLTASNRGEWGGRIEWQRKGASSPVLVAEANSIALVARGEEVFVASGLAHLGGDSGKLLRLRRSDEGWSATEVLNLGTAPYAAFRVDEHALLLADGKGLALVDLSAMSLKRLHRNDRWGYVYPNSLRPFGGAIAIGARGAVIVLRPEGAGYSERWWVPAQCGPPEGHCGCNPAD